MKNSHANGRSPAPSRAGRTPRLGVLLAAWLVLFAMMPCPAIASAATPATSAQEVGLPPIHNFKDSNPGGTPQDWAVTQGKNGVIYIGNVSDGVLAFDGAHWKSIPVPSGFVVRSLATAPDGRVYVGTVGDFGFLQPDASGDARYVSLVDKVPAADRDFSDVWQIHVTPNAVYFGTLTRIFRLHAGKITVIKPRNRFHISFLVDGQLYVIDVGRGLTRIVGNQPELVPDGARFADERIYAMLPWRGPHAKPGELLVGSRSKGWFLYDGHTFQPWPTEVDAAVTKAALYGAIWLANGRLAIATQRAGLFVLDTHGHLVRHLDRSDGLATDTIYALYQDDQQGLWLATGEGVIRVDVDSALSVFDARNGLAGSVLDVTRHAGTLYAGTTEGGFRLTASAEGGAEFVPDRTLPGKNVSFLPVGNQLLVASSAGVFAQFPDASVHQVVDAHHAQRSWSVQPMLRSRLQPERVFIGFKDGLGSIRWDGQHWIDEGAIRGAPEQADSLAEDDHGNLWLGLPSGGVGRLALPRDWSGPADPRTPRMQIFTASAGLPAGTITPTTLDGRVRFLTSNGIYRFDAARAAFAPDPEFAHLFPAGPRRIVAAQQANHDTVWLYTTRSRDGLKQTGRAVYRDGHWHWQPTPTQTLDGIDLISVFADPDGSAWLASTKGLYRYDPALRAGTAPPFATLIRKITTRDEHALALHPAKGRIPRLTASNNALRFEFAAPSFTNFAANRYQVQLEGAAAGWSPWSTATYRDYTNLDSGRYTFKVRARNVYGQLSTPAEFQFRVLPPWYRTWWAWLLWVASAATLIGLATRWRDRVLHRRNLELAELVRQRNTELAQANEALRDSNERLAEQSTTDPLTGLKNRRYLYDHLETDLATARRRYADLQRGSTDATTDASIVFLMLDIDHFKPVNDTWGHGAGDRVLQQMADILRATTREADILTRWGGEEFLLVARFVQPNAGAAFAERIRAAVAAHAFQLDDGGTLNITCSIGFATYPPFGQAPTQPGWERVVHFADECLYAAKENGRNAWAGVLPMATPPAGDMLDALHAALAQPWVVGPVQVVTSWHPSPPVARVAPTLA